MVIWKFPLSVTDIQTIMMPTGAKVLAVQPQMGELQLWALCDPDEKIGKEPRIFEIHGTGNPIEGNPGQYISTFQIANGRLVFHVFEVTPH